ncbi:MAG: hypothetical protein ABFS05_11945 [Bacteroidota bacterium]
MKIVNEEWGVWIVEPNPTLNTQHPTPNPNTQPQPPKAIFSASLSY